MEADWFTTPIHNERAFLKSGSQLEDLSWGFNPKGEPNNHGLITINYL